MSNPPSPSPLLPRRAVLAGSLAAITGPVALPDALPEAVRDAIALCLRADRAEWAVESLGLRPDLFPADGSVSA